MSRGEFRAVVEAPRPTSAWGLVTVASASLWITQQLDAWVLVVQPLLLVATLSRRLRPFAWQRSPIALNVGMFAIVGVTISVALRGGPSTIALAHFAALTQALQLIDARPRRTEFLLVALALFQVILAANLTDSPLFPPLLVAFLFAVVWTLLVHTLRSESIEANDPQPVSRALTPGLARMSLVACALSLVLAAVLFVLLPRLRSSVIDGSALGTTVATAGFSDEVELGTLGRIRQDATVVMRVETLEGELGARSERYWRGLAFDHFDGSSWSITPSHKRNVAGSPEGGIGIGPDPTVNLVQRIVREPVEAGVLFGSGEARGLQGTIRVVARDVNGGLYAVAQDDVRLRYTVGTWRERPDEGRLRRDRAEPPERGGERYLQLPDQDPAIAELASRITLDAASDAERARAIERYLVQNGVYSDTPPDLAAAPEGRSPVEAFLFGEMAAHCEYFASAFVVLARSVDLPARLVNGFAGGRRNRIGDFVELTRSDAHAWAEIHYADAGWVRYDATPSDLRARPELPASFGERLGEFASAAELWWYQRVIGFDRADQMQAIKRAYFAWKGIGRDRDGRKARQSSPWKIERGGLAWRPLAWTLLGLAVLGAVVLILARPRDRSDVPGFYRDALRLLARRGLERPPAATARDFARRVATELPGEPGIAFATLTEAYLAERFGARLAVDTAGPLRALRAGTRVRSARRR